MKSIWKVLWVILNIAGVVLGVVAGLVTILSTSPQTVAIHYPEWETLMAGAIAGAVVKAKSIGLVSGVLAKLATFSESIVPSAAFGRKLESLTVFSALLSMILLSTVFNIRVYMAAIRKDFHWIKKFTTIGTTAVGTVGACALLSYLSWLLVNYLVKYIPWMLLVPLSLFFMIFSISMVYWLLMRWNLIELHIYGRAGSLQSQDK